MVFGTAISVGENALSVTVRQPPDLASPTPLTEQDELVRSLKAAFENSFNVSIEIPAYFIDPYGADCRKRPRSRNVTSTAYIRKSERRSDLIVLQTSEDGAIRYATKETVLTPAGEIRVLVLLFRYEETVGVDAIQLWEKAQATINAEHAAFAKSRHYPAPLISFRSTNLMVEPSAVDPQSILGVQSYVASQGYRTSDYDVLMSIDMNPRRIAGGRSFRSVNFVHVGNYADWQIPLQQRDWQSAARTAYHHEIAHLWGWSHDWAATCGTPAFKPFATPVTLFGWEDVDGDGVAEIIDSTPYGRKH
jgi:hypothetical protein